MMPWSPAYLIFAAMAFAAIFLFLLDRGSRNRPEPLPLEPDNDGWPDPGYWFHEPASGEFFRIKGSHRGHTIYDRTPYAERLVEAHRAKTKLQLVAGLALPPMLITTVLVVTNGDPLFWLLACMAYGAGVPNLIVAVVKLSAAEERVGPAPRRRPAPKPANPQPHGSTEAETIG